MDFTFTEDQLLLRDTVADFLRREVTPQRIRSAWGSASGRDPALWRQLAELGLTAVTVPESQGGLGMDLLDFVLLARECGYVALPEPLVHSAMVAVPLLRDLGEPLAQRWLGPVARGEAIVVCGPDLNLLVEDAHIADLLLLEREGALYALSPRQVTLAFNESVDPSRRLFTAEFADDVAPVASGEQARSLLAASLDRGALACAAQALGLGQRMLDLAVAYTTERHQFGRPVGSFQAVKHHLADVAVQLEYARAPVWRAAHSLCAGDPASARHVSQAKLAACRAANLAAEKSIQVHGAMGYTWEADLHIYMKKAWALANTWGDAGYHKRRIANYLFDADAQLGAGATFATATD